MKIQDIVNTGTVKSLDLVASDEGDWQKSELLIEWGNNEQSYRLRLTLPDNPSMLETYRSATDAISVTGLGEVVELRCELVDDNKRNIGSFPEWWKSPNIEKACIVTIVTMPNTTGSRSVYQFRLRPCDKVLMSNLLAPTAKKPGLLTRIKRFIS